MDCSRVAVSRSSHWKTKWWIPAYSTRRENNTESLLGMLFITSVRYWINFVHTAKYKIKQFAGPNMLDRCRQASVALDRLAHLWRAGMPAAQQRPRPNSEIVFGAEISS